jgi:hypothetical protein
MSFIRENNYMLRLSRIFMLIASLAVSVMMSDSSYAQPNPSKITGTLQPVRSSGPCNWSAAVATDNTPTKVAGLWFLKDHRDHSISTNGIELTGSPHFTVNMPNEFFSRWYLVPNTLYQYGSHYTFSSWDRKKKTVTMFKEAWVYQGWGIGTKITCYGAWAGTVKYR